MSESEETEFDKAQRAEKIQQAKDLVQGICKKHPELGQAGGAMIFSRQIYRIARFEINRILTEHVKDPDVLSYAEEILVQAWAEAGDQGAADASMATTLVQGLQGTVLPFCENFRNLRRRMEHEQMKEMSEAVEAERRETVLPLGFPIGTSLGEFLPRNKTLCLVGRLPAIEWVTSEVVNSVLSNPRPKFRVVHLSKWAAPRLVHSKDEIKQKGHLNIPPNQWRGEANSGGKWKSLMASCADRLGSAIDLVVVDDISELYTSGLVGGRNTYKADHAHKHMRRWADEAGAALLVGLPFDIDPSQEGGPDLTSPAFESLRSFTTLRPVWTQVSPDDEDKTEVWIGKDLFKWVVSKEVVSC